ncbi:RNA-binding cell elongation regulator Jag/EloR [Effusibacillus pohliae]|uniref:RNA-binding cell elongation regulator Jag/EloR n=1 Tax=Effusibacillus pohliae TaxID=232270 RepID=UPI000365DB19|nr:RNA-binding cell elongation regulator Jag/EloR [Effusibacillus pohliae]
MKKVIATGKTIEEAMRVALSKLGVAEDQVEVRVLKQPSRGFLGLIGAREAEIEVSVKESSLRQAIGRAGPVAPADVLPEEDPQRAVEHAEDADTQRAVEQALEFLRNVIRSMGLRAEVAVSQSSDGHYLFQVQGDRMGILIGRRGQTLDALQYLVNLVANKHSRTFLRIVLDAEGYRARRKETLERLADRMAKQAIKERQNIELEPMPAHERKIIHTYLQGHSRVGTRSVGEEPNRKVLIYLKSFTK